jgi:hypothetical protein
MHEKARKMMGLAAVVLLGVWAAPVVAQEQAALLSAALGGPQVEFAAYRIAPDTFLLVPQQAAVNRKDPFTAGLLSWLIPGLGSFYAGNSNHGFLHLGIGLGSYAVLYGGLNSDACQWEDDCSVAGVGLVIYLGNAIWSIFAAVGDANTHNRAVVPGARQPGRVVGSLYIDPQIRVLGSQAAGTGTRPSLGLQLGRLAF